MTAMKPIFLALGLLMAPGAFSQTDSLTSAIYPVSKTAGSTTDLQALKAHASTLPAGQTNHPQRALNDVDELIFIKEGQMKVNINDSSKTLGPGSIVFIMAGDKQNFQNTSAQPVTYYVLSFKSPSPVNMQRGQQGGGSWMIDWNSLKAKKTDRGESRPIFDRPSASFTRFEIHATQLNAGVESHPPHTHRAEEIMLLMEGSATGFINGREYPVRVGDMMLVRPDALHNIKNTGTGPCWYYAMKWYN